MPQVLKSAVRERIIAAAVDEFFERDYTSATIAGIAERASVAASNIYRYFPDKATLFEATIPDEFMIAHDRLLNERITALAANQNISATADDLMQFWIINRRQVATLLDHHGPTRLGTYPDRFVSLLAGHFEAQLQVPVHDAEHQIIIIVFDNTRRAIIAMLRSTSDEATLRSMISTYWSYQLPGLTGLQQRLAGH